MNPFESLRALPRPIWIAFVATVIHRSGTMALPFLVVYLTDERRLSPEAAGGMLGMYGVGSLVAGPLAGWVVSRAGARAVMVGSLLGTSLCLVAVPAVSSPYAMAALVLGWAVVGESFRPACAAVVAELVAPERRREAFAVLRLAVNLGMSVGPAIGGGLVAISYDALFVVDAATSVLAAAMFVLPSARALGVRQQERAATQDSQPGSLGPLVLHLVASCLVALVAYQAVSTMALYIVEDLALSPAVYGWVFAFSGILIVLFELPFTAASRRWPHRPLLVAGAALTAVGFAAHALARGPVALFAIAVVWTAGEILLGPAAAARVADLEPPGRRGVYLGVYNAVWSGAFALGPWLGTHSLASLGAELHWALVGAVGLTGAALYALAPPGPAVATAAPVESRAASG